MAGLGCGAMANLAEAAERLLQVDRVLCLILPMLRWQSDGLLCDKT